MAELADAHDLGSCGLIARRGSSPRLGTFTAQSKSGVIMKTTLDISKSIKETQNKDCVHLFTVALNETQTKNLCQDAVIRLQAVVKLPGFRAGKVPLSMVKNHFADMVRDEAVEMAAKAALPEIFKQNKELNPVVQPLLRDVKYEEDKKISFEIQVETAPVFEPKDYKKIKANRKAVNITEKDVAAYISQVQEYNAYLKPVKEGTAVAKNHYIIVDYSCWENGKMVAGSEIKGDIVDMNNPQTIIGLPEAVTGAKKGETKEFISKLGDKEMQYKVTVSEIKEKVVPALDEEFFKSAGVKDEKELKENVHKMLENQQNEAADKELVEQIEDTLIKNNSFALPPTLVEQEAADLLEVYKKRLRGANVDESKMIEKLRPVAVRNLSLTYILHYIAKQEKINATDDDLKAELDKALASLKTENEKANARKLFEERKEYIRSSMVENKVISFIRENAEIKEVKASAEKKTRAAKTKADKEEKSDK